MHDDMVTLVITQFKYHTSDILDFGAECTFIKLEQDFSSFTVLIKLQESIYLPFWDAPVYFSTYIQVLSSSV